jgi:pimeloyl-ACP methyl ester carboxylesterase
MAMRGLRNLFADPTRLPQAWYESAIDEFVRVLSIRANRLATFSALRHVYFDEPFGDSGFWDRLPSLEPPALFLWGDKDVLVPASFGRFVTEALPGAQSVVLEDCGHVPQFEHPELTAQLTRDFIEALPS